MVLALIAPAFGIVSETFIRAHATHLAPGKTVLVCQDRQGLEPLSAPFLAPIEARPARAGFTAARRAIGSRLRRSVNYGLGQVDRDRLQAFLIQHHTKIVLAEYGTMGCLVRSALAELGLPLFVHFHGFDVSKLSRDWRWRRRYARLFRDGAGFIAPSQFLARKLMTLGCPSDRIAVIACGVDGHFPETSRAPGFVLAVGRLVEKKAPLLTIEAFAHAAARFPQAHLHMVGDGPLMAACTARIAALGLGRRITMHGAAPHAEVRAMLGEASIFLQHSVTARSGDTEGLPVSVLEAMAAGVPVVATQHAGIPEAIVDGECGFLVPECDVAGMAERVQLLLEAPELGVQLGRAARARCAAHFTAAKSTPRLCEFLGLPVRAPRHELAP
jgi:colanic acid/amylovoran biosynthesis glycosyltransferase